MRLIKQLENKLKTMNKVKKIDLNDLLYTDLNKLKQIKDEYNKEGNSFKKDPHTKKTRESSEDLVKKICWAII